MLIYFIQAPFTPIFKYFLLSAIFANLFMGISASTVNYTSFQIAISFIISAGIVLAANDPSEGSHSKFRSN